MGPLERDPFLCLWELLKICFPYQTKQMLQAKVTSSAASHCCVADDLEEEMLRRDRLEMGRVIRPS